MPDILYAGYDFVKPTKPTNGELAQVQRIRDMNAELQRRDPEEFCKLIDFAKAHIDDVDAIEEELYQALQRLDGLDEQDATTGLRAGMRG